MKTITLRYTGRCRECGKTLRAGTQAKWSRGAVECLRHDADGMPVRGPYEPAVKPVGHPQEDWICSDAGYEWQMQRAYERANGRW